jgi:tRNA A-37 threonylcarbamoyl transferase component Bud32
MSLCKDIAGSREITAVCLFGPWICGYADEKTYLNILLILDHFPLRLNTYSKGFDGFNASILVVNRLDFEKDVKGGWLGDFFADKLIVPYEPLINRNFFFLNELKVKKRIILELLENLILEFPESSYEFLIKQEYFMYEGIIRRAKLFPPKTYSFLNITAESLEKKNVDIIMKGYLKALNELEKEKIIFSSEGFYKIVSSYIEQVKKKKFRLGSLIRAFKRMTVPLLLNVFSESTNSIIEEQRLYFKNHTDLISKGLISQLDDPKRYIFLPTPLGKVSLTDKSDIIDFAKKIIPDDKFAKIEIEKMGGVLNEVHVLKLIKNGEEKKFLVKHFLDWSNVKWLTLTLWTFGSTSFSVLGSSRLEKEYALNTFLRENRFPVPKILYVSHKKKLIVEEFIEGQNLVDLIKRILSYNIVDGDFELVKDVGRRVAQAHNLGVSIGDCKPENFIISKNEIILLDLEQASRTGNQVWDVAEFLYFSGHYNPPTSSTNTPRILARYFIEGYLESGGKKEVIKKAGSTKYTKLFSIFTPPHVLFALSSVCKKMGNN